MVGTVQRNIKLSIQKVRYANFNEYAYLFANIYQSHLDLCEYLSITAQKIETRYCETMMKQTDPSCWTVPLSKYFFSKPYLCWQMDAFTYVLSVTYKLQNLQYYVLRREKKNNNYSNQLMTRIKVQGYTYQCNYKKEG